MQRLQETNMNKPNKSNQTNTNPTICMKLNMDISILSIGDGNLKCYPRLLDSRMEVFSTSRRFCPQNRATYVPFPIRSSCSICSPVSWDSHMVNVNTLHPIHITTPYSLVKCYKNCQCFAKSTIHTTVLGLVQKPVALCNWDTFGNSCASA